MDITPHVNLLKSLRSERINYGLLIGEAIDNAFDAGATDVAVCIRDDEITFTDNGSGITANRISALFSLGEHGPMSTTQLGRFGIGIKNHAVNAGNIFQIDSISKDGHVRAEVNWHKILKGGHWAIDDPRWLPVEVGAAKGTTITIADLRKAPQITLEKLSANIAQQFYPALSDGKKVRLNGMEVEALNDPKMTDIVEGHFDLSDGRSAQLRAGILINQPSKLKRVHVSYRHRVIMSGSSLGCSNYGGLNKMFARVRLGGPWHLAKYKDDLTDEEEREELEEVIGDALKPILEKCSSASLEARVNEISNRINDLVPPNLAAARPRHQKEDKQRKSAQKKRQRSGFVAPEKSDPPGPARTKKTPQNRLLITFDGMAEEDGIGSFQPGRPHRVNLSRDDPYVARLLEHRDQEIASHSLYVLAIVIFEEGRQSNPQLELPNLFGTFGQRIAKLMSLQESEDLNLQAV